MTRSMTRTVLGVVLVGGVAMAADQVVPTKTLLVKNPPSGEAKRKIVFKVKEKPSSVVVVGDPLADGATLHVVLTPGGDQCFSMPASGWSPIGDIGFKYKDKALADGPVKVAAIKKTPSGVFLIKAILKGSGPTPITVAPGDPTNTYGTNLTIVGGDSYCSGTATATPKPNDAKTFKVVNDTAPASCTASSCVGSPSGAFIDR